MKYIAIIGYGVVGGGITAVLEANREEIRIAVGDEVEVKYILDLRDFPDSPYGDRVVHDIAPILADPEVVLVCETMGGAHPAYEHSIACMKAGKSVVTSNKEVVATFGDELLSCARANGVNYMFEASVGGGIPVLRAFYTSLAGEKIAKITGIVNGTTNYILTRMKADGRDFDDVLKEAQALGYAERDPSADIDGIDAKRKIMILTALASGTLPADADVEAATLRAITSEDISAADKMGMEVKLLACADFTGEKISAYVSPMMVRREHPLANVSDVYNGICVTTAICGDIMYYGRGAGRLPTAGAVMADVVAVLSGAVNAERCPVFLRRSGAIESLSEKKFTYYVRAHGTREAVYDRLDGMCDNIILLGEHEGIVELTVGHLTAEEIEKLLPGEKFIRIYE